MCGVWYRYRRLRKNAMFNGLLYSVLSAATVVSGFVTFLNCAFFQVFSFSTVSELLLTIPENQQQPSMYKQQPQTTSHVGIFAETKRSQHKLEKKQTTELNVVALTNNTTSVFATTSARCKNSLFEWLLRLLPVFTMATFRHGSSSSFSLFIVAGSVSILLATIALNRKRRKCNSSQSLQLPTAYETLIGNGTPMVQLHYVSLLIGRKVFVKMESLNRK